MEPPIRLQCICGNYLTPIDRAGNMVRAECVGCGDRWIVSYDGNGNLLHVGRDNCPRAKETRASMSLDVESTPGTPVAFPQLPNAWGKMCAFDFDDRADRIRAEVEAMDWPEVIGE